MKSVVQSISFVLFGLVVIKGAFSECPDGFEHHGTMCYKAAGLSASWIEARLYCQILGSELAIINNAVEETFIEGMLARLHGAHINEEYWVSGADIASEKDWRWMGADGQSWPITYTNWGAGLPDNNGGQENCLLINHRHGSRVYWNDEKCNVLHSVMCQIGYSNVTISPTNEVFVG